MSKITFSSFYLTDLGIYIVVKNAISLLNEIKKSYTFTVLK